MPAALLEAVFIVNRNEEVRLRQPGYQRKIVSAVANAVESFWRDLVGGEVRKIGAGICLPNQASLAGLIELTCCKLLS